jgi:PAS domain S-box-containing protein
MGSPLKMSANPSTSERSAVRLSMYDPAWKPQGRVHPPKLPDDGIARRFALISRESVPTKLEDMDRKILQVQRNFAAVFHASPAILCVIQLDGLRYREINQVYEQRTGYKRREVIGKTSLGLGLWDDAIARRRAVQKLVAQGYLKGRQVAFRTKRGESLTTLLSAKVIEFDGEPCALIIAEDISKCRQAEEARIELAQRLIGAQEAECARVARELHDNIGHSLAIFSMELEKTRRDLIGLSHDDDAKFARLAARLSTLGQEVGNLSHQLHSSELEFLGIEVAMKRQLREFSEHYQVEVDCKCSRVPGTLSSEISLCLFRVVQEALHNVAKHSRATRVTVELCGGPKLLRLAIHDDGVGFTNGTKGARGLGLISMRERLHLVGGKFVIFSKPGSGTRVEAIVPVPLRNT